MPVWLIIAVTTAYVLGLFYIAWKGDKAAQENKEIGPLSGLGYALALAVYCTSWTFLALLVQRCQRVGTILQSMLDQLWYFCSSRMLFGG